MIDISGAHKVIKRDTERETEKISNVTENKVSVFEGGEWKIRDLKDIWKDIFIGRCLF